MNNYDKARLRESPNAAPLVLFMLAVGEALSGGEPNGRSREHRRFRRAFMQLRKVVDLPEGVDRKAHILMRGLGRITERSTSVEDLIEDIENVKTRP